MLGKFLVDIIIKNMGNTCEIDDSLCTGQARKEMRKEKLSVLVERKISQKDLVQIKKYNISKDYAILSSPIGQGSFGKVYKAVNKESGLVFAAKKIPISREIQKHLFQILILKQLDHPNIIRIIDVYEQEHFIYVVTEICNGGELFDRIVNRQNINEGTVRNFVQQILSAIAYCHMNKIMHRDLKPENIMLVSPQQDNIKIIDFGASTKSIKGKNNALTVGSVYYLAPEVIKRDYNEKCDIWSLGVIFYMMLSGSPPFNGKTDQKIYEKILEGKYLLPDKKFSRVSEEAKDLLKKMLQYDPSKRISARQALSHKWILNNKTSTQKLYLQNQFISIKQFCAMNKFKEHIMTYITHNLTTTEQLQKMKTYFLSIDTNGDGRISWKQFEKCYMENISNPVSCEELKEIFIRLDQNSSGFIDYSEFVTSSMSQHLLQSKQVIMKAFDMIDKDKNGYLDKEEILRAMGGMEQNLYEEMLSQCDINKDGLISKEEFMNAMLSVSEHKIKNNIIPSSTTRVQTHVH